MKANEAPEKVYFNLLLMEDGESIVRVRTFERQSDSQIEYIRADTFIEKAIKWLKEHADDYDYTWYNEMIGESGITDKMIEDFRDYMKGE